jgi:hypothetical protein
MNALDIEIIILKEYYLYNYKQLYAQTMFKIFKLSTDLDPGFRMNRGSGY